MKFKCPVAGVYFLAAWLTCSTFMFASPLCQTALAAQGEPLRIALLPILDSFPFYVAQANGYFEKEGVQVSALPVGSGLERDQLMQSGEIDGMLNEIMSAANFNREAMRVKIVSAARKAYPDYPLFRILSAPGSGIRSPGQLAGKSIGIARNTIIEYVTDRLLETAELPAGSVEKRSIPVIPERYQLLMQGQIPAATLPDPLAMSAMVAGAGLVIDDAAAPRYSMSVLTFDIRALSQRAEDVRRFLKAWDRAAAALNESPESFRSLLLEKIRVPKNVQQSYRIPPYPRREVPDPGQWADVMEWMVANGLLAQPLSYEDSVTKMFLP